ncbi:hypothetical protein [Deinococcus roseus]|nr:hypothetical protein [Deinococcus roseus]
MWGTVVVMMGAFAVIALSNFVERSHDPVWRNVLLGSILLYSGLVIYYFEKYQKLLDEMVRLRNAEAARLTFTVIMGGGMAYMMMSGINPALPQPNLGVLITATTTIYLIAYFVLWLRTR